MNKTRLRRVLVVVNPISGRGRGRRIADALASALCASGIDATVRHTTPDRNAESITRDACAGGTDAPDCVIACGGDGTIQEVANALVTASAQPNAPRRALGLAPVGRCNDFARVLGISSNLASITHALIDGVATPIDLGRVNGRYFCTVATVGVDADISSFVDSMRMPLRGTLAYVYGTLRVLMRYRGRRMVIKGDFGVVDGSMFVASAANTACYGGAIKIVPQAVPTDGALDLCLIHHVSAPRSLMMFLRVMLGSHARREDVRFVRTQELSIECDESVELWADGERVGRTPATIDVVPGAVDIMLPASGNGATGSAN